VGWYGEELCRNSAGMVVKFAGVVQGWNAVFFYGVPMTWSLLEF